MLLKQKLFGMFRWVDFNFFWTARTIWVRSRHKTARSRRARTTQGIDFWAKLYYQKLLGMKNWDGLRFFWTSRTIWVKSRARSCSKDSLV